jgi:hypothetical protein
LCEYWYDVDPPNVRQVDEGGKGRKRFMSGPGSREFPTIIRGGRNNYPARALKH